MPKVLGKQKRGGREGLSAICQRVLGKPLDKGSQLSNWARRPLTRRQQQYAALDALCLVDCVDKMIDLTQALHAGGDSGPSDRLFQELEAR